jgi:hypothetical protein
VEGRTLHEGVSVKLMTLVKVWYQGVNVKVRVNYVLSSSFETKVGVRQGETLSPLLFNINGIVQEVKGDGELGDLRISALLFTDYRFMSARPK